MYNTVREIHIAIDTGLQQVNSNRRQAFQPEQYDLILNGTILQYIEDKVDPKSNPKRDGFEDNQRRVDELKDLKKTLTLRCYNNTTNSKYSILPSDYYKLITGGCNLTNHYNKRLLSNISNNEILYKYTISFADDTPSTQGTQVYKNATFTIGSWSKLYNKPIYSKLNKFEVIQYFLDAIRKETNYNVYWEYYNNTYTQNTFIIISTSLFTNTNVKLVYTSGSNTTITANSVITNLTYTYNTTNGNTISSAIELISSKEKIEILNNYYLSKNRHNQTLCTIDNDKLNLYHDNTFLPLYIDINYIIKPRAINYYYNILPEIQITEELIQKTIDRLKIFIKDEQAYNMFLNQVQKIQ